MPENRDIKTTGFIPTIVQYLKDFGVLKDNPIEFWGIQIVNFLDSLAYFAFFSMITVFLTDDIGWGDVGAGYIFAVFTTITTILLFVSGFVTDALGIKRSVYLAMIMALVARGGMALCGLLDFPGRTWVVIPFLLLGAPSMAMTQTVFQAANRRYSSSRSRSASFNAWYLIMNIGAAGSGMVIDLFRKTLGLDNAWIYGFAAMTCIISMLAIFLMVKREKQVDDTPDKAKDNGSEKEKIGTFDRVKVLVRQAPFWRFIVLCVSVLGVRAVFLYFGMLMPKYWLRVIGEDAPIGMLQTINPILVVVGLVLMTPISSRFNVYRMLVIGATISSLSLLVLVLPWNLFGGEVAQAYINMSIVMAVFLSIGELLWSPRLNEYTAAIAPKGMEGAYLGMSMVPYFFAKLVVSAMSGHMLMRWCPEGIGESIRAGTVTFWHSPEAMWLVLFAWAIVGVAVALIFRKWLTAGADLDPASKKAAA